MKAKMAEEGWGLEGLLQDSTNHSAITLAAVTKRAVLIAAATCAGVAIPKCN